MLKFKNISKFYYNKGNVSTGFSKVNLEFNIGEFVVITGESGSGKSTLLNVISGLDKYEEGEMYINGEETSYYGENDFEEYRKKYIGNIFQNFNLVNSYTVYQNLELVLLLNGFNSKDNKIKIDKVLKEVNLYEFRNTYASKLSGGQKQRVAIARALLKDTPIIVADEPTGNLDSKASKEVLELLHKVSKNKLVIVVTHNYEEISKYATRKIKMHDGKIIEDIKIKDIPSDITLNDINYGNMSFSNKVKISIRNTFNIIPKFLLLFAVYLILSITILLEYSGYKSEVYNSETKGYNNFFDSSSLDRIVLKKNDNSKFTDLDYDNINGIDNVYHIFKDDALLDLDFNLNNETDGYGSYEYGKIDYIDFINKNLDYGVMPSNYNEIVVYVNKLSPLVENVKKGNDMFTLTIYEKFSIKVRIVGLIYSNESIYSYKPRFYVNNELINDIRRMYHAYYSKETIILNNNLINDIVILPSDNVSKGNVLISENYSYYCNNNCENNNIKLSTENIYYSNDLNLKTSKTYNEKNFSKITGYESNNYYNAFYISKDDYNSLYNIDNYQTSVFIKDVNIVNDTIKELNTLGYTTLYIKDTLVNEDYDLYLFINIISIISILIIIVAIFFISYFVIKLILRSRNIYFSIIRMLGASKKDCNKLISYELIFVANIVYIAIFIVSYLINKYYDSSFIYNITKFLSFKDYMITYLILLIISLLISNRYSKKVFNKSAMNTYRMEI